MALTYASTDLLSDLKETLQLGDAYEGTTDAKLYRLLTEGQGAIARVMAAHVPWVNYAAPEQLTTADSGYTYTFTNYPMGHAEVRGSGRNGPLLVPGADWDNGADVYVMEGQTIRFPGNRARTFADGLWARYAPMPDEISASAEPTLQPLAARPAIVYEAAALFASQGGYKDPAPYLAMRQRVLWGDPAMPGDLGVIGTLKMQYAGQGAPASRRPGGMWWYSGDLGTG